MSSIEPVFPVSSIVIVGSGIYLVMKVWDWGTPWLVVSIAAFVLIGVVAPLVQGRHFKAVDREARRASPGPIPPGLGRLIADPILATSSQVVAAFSLGIIYLMTVKPSTWIGSILTMVVAAAIGAASSAPYWRGNGRDREPGTVATGSSTISERRR
jgi:hypothetical protein